MPALTSDPPVDTAPDLQPLSNFREDPTQILQQLNQTCRAITLTVDGQPEAVLLDPEEYQRLLDLAAEASAEEGIRQGLADIAAGRTRPAREVFDELRERYRIPR